MYNGSVKMNTELDVCKGLRIYGVYKFENYPDVKFLAIDFPEIQGENYIRGLVFYDNGKFNCLYTLRLPLIGEEIGYIGDHKFKLKLIEK
jgi:hypothetical protein